MIERFLFWSWKWARRKMGLRTMSSTLLLFAAMLNVSTELGNVVRGLDNEQLWLGFLAFFGVSLGWWSGGRTFKVIGVTASAFISGVFLVWTHAGQLLGEVIPLVRGVGYLGWTVIHRSLSTEPAIASLTLSWNDFYSRNFAVFVEIRNWVVNLMEGDPSFNQITSLILWGLIIWLLASWCGFVSRRYAKPLVALIPAGVLLGGSFSYVRHTNYLGLASLIGIMLVLEAINTLYFQERSWLRRGVDFAEDIRMDVLFSVGGVTIFLVVIAAFFPIFTFRQVVGWFSSPGVQARQASPFGDHVGIGESLGLRSPSPIIGPFEKVRFTGLPRIHLLGSGPELAEEVVMIVEVENPPARPVPRYYWRSLTYDQYNGQGWQTDELESIHYREGEIVISEESPNQQMLRENVHLANMVGDFVFANGDIVTMNRDFSIAWRPIPDAETISEREFDLFGAITNSRDYRVDSILPVYSERLLRGAEGEIPGWIQDRYLQLPDTIPQRVKTLAKSLTDSEVTSYDKALAIERHLRTYSYSLDLPPPPVEQDVVDYFLFDLQEGYCDYYATSMVVLSRFVGLPARIAVGFASGTFDEANNRYLVTGADAHSWVEVYFPEYGWIPFEPTAGQPELTRPDLLPEIHPELESALRPFTPKWQRIAGWTGLTVFAGLLLFVIGFFAWMLVDSWRLKGLAPTETTANIYQRLYPIGRRLAVPALPGDTPYEYVRSFGYRLNEITLKTMDARILSPAAQELGSLVKYYILAVYSPEPLLTSAQDEVLRVWRRLQLRLWWARLRVHLGRWKKS